MSKDCDKGTKYRKFIVVPDWPYQNLILNKNSRNIAKDINSLTHTSLPKQNLDIISSKEL
jgi:hypothetical protein